MSRYSGRVRRCIFTVSIFMLSGLWFCKTPASAQTLCGSTYGLCVTTWQQDAPGEVCSGCAYRTGENLSETTITPSSIQTDNFKQLCSQGLDGQVYAQPLVVTGVTINHQTYPNPLVYAVTQKDTLYQIDGVTCAIVNQLPFLTTQGLPTYGQYAANCALQDRRAKPQCTGIGVDFSAGRRRQHFLQSAHSATRTAIRPEEAGAHPFG